MTIFDRIQKHVPEVGDVIEGYYREIGGGLFWCSMRGDDWKLCYGVVTAKDSDSITVEGYKAQWQVSGPFIGSVLIDNSDIMDKGEARIWLVLPLGISRKGYFVNPPVPGLAVFCSL